MRPIPVVKPKTLEEALGYLAEGGRPLAGGTDLLVSIRKGQENPDLLVYVGDLPELRTLRKEEEGLEVGAALTHAELLAHPATAAFPILRQVLRTLGSPAIRAMGTLGGNMGTASPAGDGLVALYLLEARVRLVSARGGRELPIWEFIVGPRRTALRPGELVRSVLLPWLEGEPKSFFRKVGRRRALIIAVASLGALVWVEGGRVARARLALGSVAPTVLRPTQVEEALAGRPISPAAWEDLVPLLSAATQPISDLRASAEYRRNVAGRLLLSLAKELSG